MSAKRTKLVSKKKAQSFDPLKFCSFEASESYSNVFKAKTVVPERGFDNPPAEIKAQIHSRNWELFCAQPDPCYITLVREFYANFLGKKNGTCYDRGVWVPCSSEAINALFNLADVQGDMFTALLNHGADYTEVLTTLARPGTQWRMREERIVNFSASDLLPIPRAWLYFISARLIPSGHTSDVTKDRAVLAYAIMKNLTINVGKVILQSMTVIARRTSTGGLSFPWIICQLCKRAGVPVSASEELTLPKAPLTEDKIGRMRPHRYRDVSYQPGSSTSAPGPSSRPRKSVEERLEDIEFDISYLQETQRSMSSFVDSSVRQLSSD